LKKVHIGLVTAAFLGAGALFLISRDRGTVSTDVVLAVSETPELTSTATSTVRPSATSTLTVTPTSTFTATSTPTNTPPLESLVLYVTVINPGVTLDSPPSPTVFKTDTPLPTFRAPFPSGEIALVGTGAPDTGWVRYESANIAYNYTEGRWFRYRADRASARGYSYSADKNARVMLSFVGAVVRVRYVAYSLYGIFEIYIDGQLAATVDSYSPNPAFLSTDIFGLTWGEHTVEIVNTGRKNAASTGYLLALDSVEVYRTTPPTSTPTSTATIAATFTPSPVAARRIELISAPPTAVPSATPATPSPVRVSLVIAYDENGNKVGEPAEGVRGISVRLMRVGTNEIIASGFTNREGYVRLETLSDSPVRLVVPYFGKYWDVSNGRAEQRFTLILPPGNQPGLIP
jgi:hypothetical protein